MIHYPVIGGLIPQKTGGSLIFGRREIFEKSVSEKSVHQIIMKKSIIKKNAINRWPSVYYKILNLFQHNSGCSVR